MSFLSNDLLLDSAELLAIILLCEYSGSRSSSSCEEGGEGGTAQVRLHRCPQPGVQTNRGGEDGQECLP